MSLRSCFRCRVVWGYGWSYRVAGSETGHSDMSDAKLNELDKQEMRDISRAFKPEMTDEKFDAIWAEFVRLKTLKSAN